MTVDLRPHQRSALAKMANAKILWGGVGSGKSRVAVEYYRQHETPKDVYVITTAKKRDTLDWEGEFARVGIGKAKGATVAGVLTVDSWNMIAKYTAIENAFFIFDEQRLVGSGTWVKSFIKIAKRNRWIMLSATPGDTWMDYIPVFVANEFYKNRTEFKREHVVYNTFTKFPKVDRYIGVNRLVRHRNDVLVKMRYSRETVRHTQTVLVDYDKETMAEVTKGRWNVFKDEPIRDVSELFMCMREVAYRDDSRLEAVRELLKKHDKLIVFYNFNYELNILRELASEVTLAEWNGHKHQELPKSDKWVYLVQYLAGSEGWNAVETNATCFYSLTYSYKLFEQAHGRTDRLNTPFIDLYYYILMCRAPIDAGVWRALKAKKSFQPNEKEW